MKKVFRITFLLVFLLFFLLMGISTAIQAKQRRASPDLTSGPAAVDSWISKHLPNRQLTLAPYRLWNATLGRRYFPDNNALINESGQFVGGSSQNESAIHDAADNVVRLNAFCQKLGKNFLYIVLPGKPEFDRELTQIGIPCYRNDTADKMIQRLQRKHVSCLDLRELFRTEEDFYSFFYKTEHHWTADAGLIAAREIALRLNEQFGMELDAVRLNEDLIGRQVYPGAFVGEQGEKALGRYGEVDDFIVRYPLYETHLRYLCRDDRTDVNGGFEILTDQEMLTRDHLSGGKSLYYYYLFQNNGLVEIWDDDVPAGDIFFIKDSFANVVTPFLSLTANHVTAWDMRFDTHVYTYLVNHPEIETVIVAYQLGFIPVPEMNDFQ